MSEKKIPSVVLDVGTDTSTEIRLRLVIVKDELTFLSFYEAHFF